MRPLVVALAVFLLATPVFASDPPPLITSWGGAGSGPGQFDHPSDIAIAPSGDVYVVDRNNHRVQYFSASGSYLGEWGSEGSDPGQFQYPQGIAIDESGNVYVTDVLASRVEKFTGTGGYLTTFANEHIYRPVGIAVDGAGSLYIGNSHPLQMVSKFDASGRFLMAFEPAYGWGVDVDQHGCVFATDVRMVVQRFSADGTLAALWFQGGGFPEDATLGVAVDDAGNALVIRAGFAVDWVYVFSHDLARIDYWSPPGPSGGVYPKLGGIALGDGGVLYLTDNLNDVILKLQYSAPVPTTPATWGSLKATYR